MKATLRDVRAVQRLVDRVGLRLHGVDYDVRRWSPELQETGGGVALLLGLEAGPADEPPGFTTITLTL